MRFVQWAGALEPSIAQSTAMKFLAISIAVSIATISANHAVAAISRQTQSEAIQLMDSGNARAAYNLLRKEKKTTAQD
ncbi:MAG: hypothetical protein GY761_11200 [Hyphomicrobiales bacterium]|nr:hypothetical protein [Hyphomicrobiales bacterium]